MPLLLWVVNRESAACLRAAAKDCSASDEGANCTVDGARADDGVTETIAQSVVSGE